MKTELLVAMISGAVALSAGALAVWGQFRSARLAAEMEELRLAEQRRIESEKALFAIANHSQGLPMICKAAFTIFSSKV